MVVEADVVFPVWEEDGWRVVRREDGVEEEGMMSSFVVYERIESRSP